MKSNLLIIGSLPPPIGGVTLHVKRLLEYLENEKLNVEFLDLKKKNIFRILWEVILKYKVIHLHTSNPKLRFITALLCRLFNKRLLITYHGNLGRFNLVNNFFDYASISLCKIPIVLNKESYKKATQYNESTVQVTSFIPPIYGETNSNEIEKCVVKFKKQHSKIFCTNASTVSYDKEGNEIYGILDLIEVFSKLDNLGLIVSDSSKAYQKLIREKNIKLENILLISEEHSFFEITKYCDGMIRNTSTDGDAISIKEALYLNKQVMATNVVSRDHQVEVYNSYKQLMKYLLENKPKKKTNYNHHAGKELLKIYKNVLC